MFFQVQLGYNELQSFNGEIGSEHAYKTTYILGCENSSFKLPQKRTYKMSWKMEKNPPTQKYHDDILWQFGYILSILPLSTTKE